MASIIVMNGSQKGDYYPLGYRTNVIGREETNPIQILDERVSRKHLQISCEQGRQNYYALDMKSKHGVFINGRKIETEITLVDGDQIQIGDTVLLFTINDFTHRSSALSHFKKVGERIRTKLID